MVKLLFMWVGYAQGRRCEGLKLTHESVWAKQVRLKKTASAKAKN